MPGEVLPFRQEAVLLWGDRHGREERGSRGKAQMQICERRVPDGKGQDKAEDVTEELNM